MAITFLLNTAGDEATSYVVKAGATASGYDINDTISGDRAAMWRSDASATAIKTMYRFGADTDDYDHAVICRADKLLTEDTAQVKLITEDAAQAETDLVDLDPITSSDLVGIHVNEQSHGQDYVTSISPTANRRGYGLYFLTKGGGSEALKYSKLYFCDSFSFGQNPCVSKEIEWSKLSVNQRFFRPKRSDLTFETDTRITMGFERVTASTLDSFLALSTLFNWPLFIYDSTQDLIEWKLEHVVLENAAARQSVSGQYEVDLSFRRLAHYP